MADLAEIKIWTPILEPISTDFAEINHFPESHAEEEVAGGRRPRRRASAGGGSTRAAAAGRRRRSQPRHYQMDE